MTTHTFIGGFMSYDLAPQYRPPMGSGKTRPARLASLRDRAVAQAALNFHPISSPYWATDLGMETLLIAKAHGIKPRNTNRERRAMYASYSSQVFA